MGKMKMSVDTLAKVKTTSRIYGDPTDIPIITRISFVY